MKLIKVKRTDSDAIWDVTEEYYEEYKSILEYIETWDSDTGEVLEHKDKSKGKKVIDVVEVEDEVVVEEKEVKNYFVGKKINKK